MKHNIIINLIINSLQEFALKRITFLFALKRVTQIFIHKRVSDSDLEWVTPSLVFSQGQLKASLIVARFLVLCKTVQGCPYVTHDPHDSNKWGRPNLTPLTTSNLFTQTAQNLVLTRNLYFPSASCLTLSYASLNLAYAARFLLHAILVFIIVSLLQ